MKTWRDRYVFTVDAWKPHGLRIETSIGGGRHTFFTVDTGSIGIVVSPGFLGPFVCESNIPFHFEYSSSKNVYEGNWVVACVRFGSPKGDSATTKPMWIRKVVRWKKHNTGDWRYDPHVYMLGVGFDRGHGHAQDPSIPSSDVNPFLLLEEMCRGAMIPGYILTTTSIQLGLTQASTEGFTIVQLERRHIQDEAGKEQDGDRWAAPMVHLSVSTPPAAPHIEFDASLLVDTGLNYAIVQAPKGVDPKLTGSRVDKGQRIKIDTLVPPSTLYDFVVDEKQSGAPDHVQWTHYGRNFVNTSMYTLEQVDYLYDSQAGHLGFRACNRGQASLE